MSYITVQKLFTTPVYEGFHHKDIDEPLCYALGIIKFLREKTPIEEFQFTDSKREIIVNLRSVGLTWEVTVSNYDYKNKDFFVIEGGCVYTKEEWESEY